MSCKCKDFKCAKDCQCPHHSKSNMVLEEMLSEMLDISGLNNDRPSGNNPNSPSRDNSRIIPQSPLRQVIMENIVEQSPLRQVLRGNIEEEWQGEIEENDNNETMIDEVCPPQDFYNTYYELEDERNAREQPPRANVEQLMRNTGAIRKKMKSPKTKAAEKKAAMDRAMASTGGLRRRGTPIESREDARNRFRDCNPAQVSEMIDTNLASLTAFQQERQKPVKDENINQAMMDQCMPWSEYLDKMDRANKRPRTMEKAMNEMYEQWAAHTDKKRRNRRRPQGGYDEPKVYPPERYIA